VFREGTETLVEIEEFIGEAVAWLRSAGARDGHVAIIRPDKFVYALVPGAEVNAAVAKLFEALGFDFHRQRIQPGRPVASVSDGEHGEVQASAVY